MPSFPTSRWFRFLYQPKGLALSLWPSDFGPWILDLWTLGLWTLDQVSDLNKYLPPVKNPHQAQPDQDETDGEGEGRPVRR